MPTMFRVRTEGTTAVKTNIRTKKPALLRQPSVKPQIKPELPIIERNL
jgi:hypothetical protein